MIEDFFTLLRRPLKASSMLLLYLNDYMEDDIASITEPMTAREKKEGILTIRYILELINHDTQKLFDQYYEDIIDAKYSNHKIST